jgi:hypothetical protein
VADYYELPFNHFKTLWELYTALASTFKTAHITDKIVFQEELYNFESLYKCIPGGE